MTINPGKCSPGQVIEQGGFCRVVLAVDHRDAMPCQKEFFRSTQVGDQDKKKMLGELRKISRHGYARSNPQRYKRFGETHYIKVHGFRAIAFERPIHSSRELVVCLIVPKKSDDALDDSVFERARRLFTTHCERFPNP